MMSHFIKCLLLGALVTIPVGCEPRPVVVDPDDEEATDTTIIEEDRDVDIVPDGAATTPESGTNVDVGVGGREGVDVNVSGEPATQPADNQPTQNP